MPIFICAIDDNGNSVIFVITQKLCRQIDSFLKEYDILKPKSINLLLCDVSTEAIVMANRYNLHATAMKQLEGKIMRVLDGSLANLSLSDK